MGKKRTREEIHQEGEEGSGEMTQEDVLFAEKVKHLSADISEISEKLTLAVFQDAPALPGDAVERLDALAHELQMLINKVIVPRKVAALEKQKIIKLRPPEIDV